METYLLMLYVTLEQENAIKELFIQQKWTFKKKEHDSENALTKLQPTEENAAYFDDPGDDGGCDDIDDMNGDVQNCDDGKDDSQKDNSVSNPLPDIPRDKNQRIWAKENSSKISSLSDVPFEKEPKARRSMRLQGNTPESTSLIDPTYNKRKTQKSKQMQGVNGQRRSIKKEVDTNTKYSLEKEKNQNGTEEKVEVQDEVEKEIVIDLSSVKSEDNGPAQTKQKLAKKYKGGKKTSGEKKIMKNKKRERFAGGKEFSRECCRAPEGTDLPEGRPPRRRSTKEIYVYDDDDDDLDEDGDLVPYNKNTSKSVPRKPKPKNIGSKMCTTRTPDSFKKDEGDTTGTADTGKVGDSTCKQKNNAFETTADGFDTDQSKAEQWSDDFFAAWAVDADEEEDSEKPLDPKALRNLRKKAKGETIVNKTCSICHKLFRKYKAYRAHMQRHEENDDIEWGGEHEWVEPKGPPKKPKIWPYKCNICEKTFQRPEHLAKHINNHAHDVIKTSVCTVCSCDCKFPSTLAKHMKKHEKIKGFKCQFCDKVWKTRSRRTRHEAVKHAVMSDKDIQRVFKCTTCEKILFSKNGLDNHLKRHAGEQLNKTEISKLMCDLCGRTFNKSDSLKNHINMHKNIRNYKCNVCGKDFVRRNNWKDHMKAHMGDKRYKCKYCDKAFVGSGSLVRHVRIHTGEKPYSCEVCGARFNQVGSVKLHMRIHTGVKPYSCDLCDQSFTQPSSLILHKRKAHRVDKPTKVRRYASFGRQRSASLKTMVEKPEKAMPLEHTKGRNDVAVQSIISEPKGSLPALEQQSSGDEHTGTFDDSVIQPSPSEATVVNHPVDTHSSGYFSSFSTYIQMVSSQNVTESANPRNSSTVIELDPGN